jgi:hypothetical protein
LEFFEEVGNSGTTEGFFPAFFSELGKGGGKGSPQLGSKNLEPKKREELPASPNGAVLSISKVFKKLQRERPLPLPTTPLSPNPPPSLNRN